jgi:hypothetical protein
MSSTVKHPEVKVKLVGEDGNAFFILGRCEGAMKKAGLSKEERETFQKEATAGDYNHLLCTVMAWFTVDEEEEEG